MIFTIGFIFIQLLAALAAFEVLFSRSLLRKILGLVGVFLSLMLGCIIVHVELLAFVLVIVYVGAIAVLFLFVVMLINITMVGVGEKALIVRLQRLLFTLVTGGFLFGFLAMKQSNYNLFTGLGFLKLQEGINLLVFSRFLQVDVFLNTAGCVNFTDVEQVGVVLWNFYSVWCILVGFVLLVSILGSIVSIRGMLYLTNEKRFYLQRMGVWKYRGALTNKPYAFRFRSWELTELKTCDLFDTLTSDLVVGIRGLQVMRVLPGEARSFEFPWLSDKVRFFFDALNYQRLKTPMLCVEKNSYDISWRKSLILSSYFVGNVRNAAYKQVLSVMLNRSFTSFGPTLRGVHGIFGGIREISALKQFAYRVGGGSNYMSSGLVSETLNSDTLNNFVTFVSSYQNMLVSNQRLLLILVGIDLRFEAPRLNTIVRALARKGRVEIYSIGVRLMGLYPSFVKIIDTTLSAFGRLLEGRHLLANMIVKHYKCYLSCGVVELWGGYSMHKWLSSKGKMYNSMLLLWLEKYKIKFSFFISRVGHLNQSFLGTTRDGRPQWQNSFYQEGVEVLLSNGDGGREVSLEVNKYNVLINLTSFWESYGSVLLLPTPVFLERRSTVINILGYLKTTNVVIRPPVFRRLTYVRTEHSILKWVGWQLAGPSQIETLFAQSLRKQKNEFNTQRRYVPFTLSILTNHTIFITSCCLKFVCNWFVPNFFSTDTLSNMSKILSTQSVVFYKDNANYDL